MSSKTDVVQRNFIKTGIAVAIDGSQDEDIHIEGLEDYQVDSEEDEDDPFADSVVEADNQERTTLPAHDIVVHVHVSCSFIDINIRCVRITNCMNMKDKRLQISLNRNGLHFQCQASSLAL